MKKLIRAAGLIVLLTAAAAGGFLAGRSSIKPVIGATIYASIEEIRENHLTVQGLPVNDINGRGRFQFTVDEDTVFEWRYTEISLSDLDVGDNISITYTGAVQEISPAILNSVVRIQLLDPS